MNLDGNFPSYEQQEIIKTAVDNIKMTTDSTKVSVDQVKQEVATISTQIENKNASKVLKCRVFESTGTFTVPDGVTEVYLTGCAGGGGGGGYNGTSWLKGVTGGVTSFGTKLTLSGGTGGESSGGKGTGAGGDGGGRAGAGNADGGTGCGGAGFSGGNAPALGKGALGDGGGGSSISTGGFGGGGGAGDYKLDFPIIVTPRETISVQIGKGGAGAFGGGTGGDGLLIVKWWE